MIDREIPTMEQCIDHHCMCISREHPKGYRGLSPEYERKLAKMQAEMQADYDTRMSEAEAAQIHFGNCVLFAGACFIGLIALIGMANC